MNLQETFTLKCLTFNTWGIRIMPHQKLRLRAISTTLQERKEDIVCLQEVWSAKDRELIVAQNHHSYPYSFYFASNGVGSGLLTLSKHPIIETAFIQFRARGRADRVYYGDYIAGKGIGLTCIKTPSGILDLYNTHTVAQYDSDHRDEFRAHRRSQHYQITQFIQEHTTTNPVILLGDFNMRPDQPNYTLITTLANVSDSYSTVNPDDGGYTLSTENPFHDSPDLRLDYIFKQNGKEIILEPIESQVTMKYLPFTARRIAYSDHFGVSTTFEIAHAHAKSSEPDIHVQIAVEQATIDVLKSGIAHAELRHKHAIQQLKTTYAMSLSLLIVSTRLPKPMRWLLWSICITYILLKRRIAQRDLPQEVDALTKTLDEVAKQKARHSVTLR